MTAIRQLDQSLQRIKKTVSDLNKLLATTATLANRAGLALETMGPRGVPQPGSGRGGGASQGGRYNPNRMYTSPIGPSATPPRYSGPKPPKHKPQKSFQDKALDALMTSRIGAGGVMPVVSKLAALLPPEFRAMAVAGLFAVRVATEVAEAAMEHVRAITGTYTIGGGTPGQAGMLNTLGSSIGTNGLGASRNLMNGYGPMYAAQAGVNPLGGPFGDNDYAKKTVKLLELIAKQQSFSQARRVAEGVGDPELAKFYLLSKNTQALLSISAKGGVGQETISAQSNLSAQLELLKKSSMDLISIGLTPVTQAFASMLEPVNALLIGFTYIGKHLAELTPSNIAKYIYDKVTGHTDTHQDALERNTNALDNLNKSIGTYGGGERAQNAIPKAQRTPGYYSKNNPTQLGIVP